MSWNDHYVDHTGKVRSGALEPPLEDNLERLTQLQSTITEQLHEARMLKGTGFIVIDPSDPRFTGEEYGDVDDAKLVGSNLSYQSRAGYVIIYAPVAIQRPKREVAETIPSKLLQQIGATQSLPSGGPVAVQGLPKE